MARVFVEAGWDTAEARARRPRERRDASSGAAACFQPAVASPRFAHGARQHVASQAYALELYDFGTDDELDWSRLPLLKDPRAAG